MVVVAFACRSRSSSALPEVECAIDEEALAVLDRPRQTSEAVAAAQTNLTTLSIKTSRPLRRPALVG